MIAWELHDSLARSIGDPLLTDSGNSYILSDAVKNIPIPDGVRYTHAIRNQYLNKAMISIQREALNNVVSLPRVKGSIILQRIFPSMTKNYTTDVTLSAQAADSLWLYNVILYSANIFPAQFQLRPNRVYQSAPIKDYSGVNIPIMDESLAKAINARSVSLKPDLVAYVTSNNGIQWFGLLGVEIEDLLFLHNSGTPGTVEVTYLPIAPRMENYAIMDKVEFEPTFESLILSKAIMYAQMDSGELGASYQSVPFLEQVGRREQNGSS